MCELKDRITNILNKYSSSLHDGHTGGVGIVFEWNEAEDGVTIPKHLMHDLIMLVTEHQASEGEGE